MTVKICMVGHFVQLTTLCVHFVSSVISETK